MRNYKYVKIPLDIITIKKLNLFHKRNYHIERFKNRDVILKKICK